LGAAAALQHTKASTTMIIPLITTTTDLCCDIVCLSLRFAVV
jgi:hypothetical protein